MRTLVLSIALLTSANTWAIPVTYEFVGQVTSRPTSGVPLDTGTDVMRGWITYDTATFNVNPKWDFSHGFSLGSNTWQSSSIPDRRLSVSSDGRSVSFYDEQPRADSVDRALDIITTTFNFAAPLGTDDLLPFDSFIGGSFSFTYFFFGPPDPLDRVGMGGTITSLTVVPEPGTLSLFVIGALFCITASASRSRTTA